MKKVYTISLMALVLGVSSTKSVVNANPITHPASSVYDSTTNFLGTDVSKYVGQELYVYGKAKEDQDFGYSGFYNIPNPAVENVFKPNTQYYTTYGDVAGKRFKVIEVIKHPTANDGFFSDRGTCFLKLEDQESKNTVYYEYNSINGLVFPFFVTGYYQKATQSVKGRDYVFPDNVMKDLFNKTDIETGKPITTKTAQYWRCMDVKMAEGNHTLVQLLQNALGEKTTVPYGSRCFDQNQIAYYRKKFGDATFFKLLQGTVTVGMTKEMCKFSIGEPYSVSGKLLNKTLGKTTEEWVYYSGNDLFFDNDVLVDIRVKTN